MLRNERTPIEDMETKTDAATAITDEAFIPLAFAEETIESLTKKLMQIRSKHHAILGQVDEAYGARAKATKEHYTKFIAKLKKTAAEKIMHYKHVIQVWCMHPCKYELELLLCLLPRTNIVMALLSFFDDF